MTPQQWDVHWDRIRGDLVADGADPDLAIELADEETTEQFGPRPEEP